MKQKLFTLYLNSQRSRRLRADEFISGNSEHLEDLRRMGIKIVTMNDGRVQLLHTASEVGIQVPPEYQWGTSVLVHYLALIGDHRIVRITHCRWRCGSLVMQCHLSLLFSMRYQLLLLSITYHCDCL